MRWLIKWAPLAALSIGPCAAWLVWSITRKRWGHAVCAAIANLALWTTGPALLMELLHHVH